MINPYGVPREYDLWREEVEWREGRARGLAHQVGLVRRHKAAATELRRGLGPPPAEAGRPRGGWPALARCLRALRLRRRPLRRPCPSCRGGHPV